MSSFNREEFAVRSKSELLDYIESQSEQISRLETRFRDVVRAYRGLIKEKEALDASLSALGQAGGTKEEKEGEKVVEEGGEGEGERPDESGEGETEEGEEGGVKSEAENSDKDVSLLAEKKSDAALVASLRQQLVTLTTSLQTLTVERGKSEANFQKDKKSMLAQHESMVKQHQVVKRQLEEDIEKLQLALQESQASLRSERVNREEEQRTHADMLRELQSLIASEREGKEALGLQLQEMECEMLSLHSRLSDQRSERGREMTEAHQSLTLHVTNLQAQLELAEKRSSQPSAELIQLQKEMERLKVEHGKSLLLEQQRASDLEDQLKQQSTREEQTVASLESKLSHLSETVGSHVLLREQDQSTIQKIKERINQLDVENTQLTREHLERHEVSTHTAGQVTGLHEKITRLKTLLKLATSKITEKGALPSNLEEMTIAEYRDLIGRESTVKQELCQLRDEFERYKARAQTVLCSKENKDSTAPLEQQRKNTESIQSRLLELQEQVHTLQNQKEEEEERHLMSTRKLREEIREIADRNRAEVVAMETQHKEKLQDLHRHVTSTRERTLKLLAEKDAEISHLRSQLQSLRSHSHSGGLERSLSGVSTASISSNHADGMGNGELERDPATPPSSLFQTNSNSPSTRRNINLSSKSTESISAVQEILEQPSPAGPAKEPQLLHYIHEQHRRETELSAVRRKKFELEDVLRDLQEREQRHLEQGVFLKDQIRKLERDRSRETESMEYLKNIIFHFMCSDSYGREQMVLPIATILHFSPDEVRSIKDKAAARRWIPRNA